MTEILCCTVWPFAGSREAKPPNGNSLQDATILTTPENSPALIVADWKIYKFFKQ